MTTTPFRAAGLLILLLIAATGCAPHMAVEQPAIMETSDLRDIAIAVNKLSRQVPRDDILVVFDLDNTLLTMDSELGSVAWYDWQSELARAPGCQAGELNDRLAVQDVLYFLGSMQPVQPDAAEIIRDLQAMGSPVMVLTARGSAFNLSTQRELQRNQLSFTALQTTSEQSQNLLFTPPSAARAVLYSQGVMMVAGQHKGQMLLDLYTRLQLPLPAAVVMADDSLSNLTDVQQALTAQDIAHRLFRYSRADKRIARFDPRQADLDWQALEPAIAAIRDSMNTQNLPDLALLSSCKTD